MIIPKVANPLFCPTGHEHAWVYHRENHVYFCTLCGGGISKNDLRKETAEIELEVQPLPPD